MISFASPVDGGLSLEISGLDDEKDLAEHRRPALCRKVRWRRLSVKSMRWENAREPRFAHPAGREPEAVQACRGANAILGHGCGSA
jgi:hypothetical protein